MIEAKEVARHFKEELNELLKRHKATIEVENAPFDRYAYSAPQITIKAYIPTDYDADGECLAESTEIELGSYIDGD